MNTQEVRRLRELYAALREAVSELVEPVTMMRYVDNGERITHGAPSLIDQLRDAIANSMERGTTSAFGSKIPVCIAAMDLHRQVECAWKERGYGLTESLRRIPRRVISVECWTDLDAVAALVHGLRATATAIRSLLDPPRRLHVAAACPACGVRMVWRRDGDGDELVQVPALTVDGVTGCHCQACGHVWPTSHLELLAGALGCDPVS